MPVIYEYLGIAISFWSNEHEPIHIHAVYGETIMKVSFFIEDGIINQIKYEDVGFKKFNKAKLKQLKDFISVYQYSIIYAWKQVFELNVQIQKVRITKRIKNGNKS